MILIDFSFCLPNRNHQVPLRHLQGYEPHLRDGRLLLHVGGEGQGQQDNLQFPVSLRLAKIVLLLPRPRPHNNSSPLHTVHCNFYNNNNNDIDASANSCLHMSQSFPPGRFIWCNEGLQGGPTARPAALRGGHACCKDRDFCNLQLRPVIKYYAPRDRAGVAAAPAGPGGLQTPTLIYEGALWLCTSMSLSMLHMLLLRPTLCCYS